MLKFVLRKMLNKRWLMAALLIGNALLVAVAASSPMYTRAALQRMLTSTFSRYVEANGRYASTAFLISTLSVNLSPDSVSIAAFNAEDELARTMPEKLGVPARHVLTNMFYSDVPVRPEPDPEAKTVNARLGFLSGLEEHSVMLDGQMYSDAPVDGVIEVVVSRRTLIAMRMVVGETLVADKFLDKNGEPLKLRITGCFDADGEADGYWYKPPTAYFSDLFMSENNFRALAGDGSDLPYQVKGLWFVIMDYNGITVDNAQYLHDMTAEYNEYHRVTSNISYTNYYDGILAQYLVDAARISVTLRILQIPVYALLAAFIFMVAGQILSMESAEISVLKSRGAGRGQILAVYLTQSGLVAAAGLILGIPLAIIICQALGSANAFLEFVARQSLRVQLTGEVLLYALAAAVFSVLAMVLPALSRSKLTIVDQKQKKSARRRPWWQKFFLDLILLAVSLYGLYSYSGQREVLAQRVQQGAGLDPLLFLSSSLFIIGCGLLALRVVPALVWLVYSIGQKRWKPEYYASFLQVMRTRDSQGYIVAFLVITLAIGVFNAQAARTINSNEEQRIDYTFGAELVLAEPWGSNSQEVQEDELGIVRLAYEEPDYRRYLDLLGKGADSVTKVVYDGKAACATPNGRWINTTVMGIHTREFGETVEFDSTLLPVHWYEYLNAMSQSPTAVLVSSNMRDKQGYKLGDSISYRSSDGFSCRGVIYGFVDYWPAYSPTTSRQSDDGSTVTTDNYLIVANLSYLQSQWGVTPYQIWIRSENGDTGFIYDFIDAQGLSLTEFRDGAAQKIAIRNDPIFQGTNGILTVGFVVVLLVCSVGFLIYWIMSIRSRELQFGIFRAMGMSMREIIRMLINEQIFISGVSVALGVGAGLLASRLYIPLVQIAYAPADTVIPLRIISQPGDMVRLLAVIAVVIAVCMVILAGLIRRIRISQALKLGEE